MMANCTDVSRIVCSGDALLYIGQPAQFTVDTRHAGPGELGAFCDSPQSEEPAVCDVIEHHNGLHTVQVTAQRVGQHALYLQYAHQNVPDSPFRLRASSANLVTVSGPGIEHGVFSTFTPAFIVDATEAIGPGEIRVRVGGQPGTFKVQTKATGRRLRCSYNAMATGLYTIHITWSDDPVPGSPFKVNVFETEDQLQRFVASAAGQRNSCVVS